MANTTNLDLVKPLGTDHALISVINGNMDKVDAYAGKVNDSLAGVQDGLAIVAVGDTHAAITSGQFVYVKEHNTLPEGLYTASTNIAANGALSTSNLTADSKGGLNALSDQIGNIHSVYRKTYPLPSSLTISAMGTQEVGTMTDLCESGARFLSGILSAGADGDVAKCIVVVKNWNWNQYVNIFNISNSSATIASGTSLSIYYTKI